MFPQLQTIEKIVNASEIQTLQCTEYNASAARALVDGPVVKVVLVPQVQVVEKSIEIPQLHSLGKVVDTPTIQSVQSTKISESLDIIHHARAKGVCGNSSS